MLSLRVIVFVAIIAIASGQTLFAQEYITEILNNVAHPPAPTVAEEQQFIANDVIVNVTTPLGIIRGFQQSGFRTFRGIPYAEAPTGNNRWAPPIPVSGWLGVYDALNFKAGCPQINNSNISNPLLVDEDCLFLNIWTPLESKITTPLPVMVWFHGGAFINGWGGDKLFWGDFITNSTSDTIVVTTNYRLGALGFTATPELSGNYGFLDQQQTLRWVQENIAAFGGDPSQVTIFGQSAGAMSVTLHVVTPSSQGLFSQAIIESNPAGINYNTREASYKYSIKLAGFLGCNYTDTACLRSKSWQDIVGFQTRTYIISVPIDSTEIMPFSPVIDGVVIPKSPMDWFRSGSVQSAAKAIAIGTNRNETRAIVPELYLNQFVYKSLLDAVWGDNATLVLNQYPASRGSNYNQFTILTTDWLFTCPSLLATNAFVNSGISTYAYNFQHPPSNDPINDPKRACTGAVCHSAEIPYVFHSNSLTPYGSYTADENTLSLQMMTYWRNFAHGITAANQYSSLAWPTYNSTDGIALDFDIPISTIQHYHQQQCQFWDSLGYYN